MDTEIEVKFVNIDHDEIRSKLTKLGAKLISPMRVMRRVIIETPDLSAKNAFIRIRDEGHRTTITYKQFDNLSVDGAKEIEIVVNDFQKAIDLFSASNLKFKSYQESKRENWVLGNVEVVLDQWPWLDTYLEIEGKEVKDLKSVAKKLGLKWEEAIFGGVMAAYKVQYPHLSDKDTVANLPIVKFDDPLPPFLREVS